MVVDQQGRNSHDGQEVTTVELTDKHVQAHEPVDNPTPSTLQADNKSFVADVAFMDSAVSIADTDCPRIQAFAKLEFDDGQFYMNTYAVELGRDVRAARLAFHNGMGSDHEVIGRHHKHSNSSVDTGQTGRGLKQDEAFLMANGVVSEIGGIIGVDMSDSGRRKRTRTKKTKSTSSSSHNISRKDSMRYSAPQTDYQKLAMASLYDFQSADALSFLPSPEECPLIPIHPPAVAEGGTTGHRGISRRHVRIAYNFELRLFQLEVEGKNGAFIDEQYYEAGETQELRSGSYIQIGGVGVRFVLPDVAIGETGAEGTLGSDAISGGAMSFDFEDGRGESLPVANSDTSTTASEDGGSPANHYVRKGVRGRPRKQFENEDVDSDEDDEDDDENEEEELEDEMQAEAHGKLNAGRSKISLKVSKPKAKPEPKVEVKPGLNGLPPKRKGPGRPPKNGITSKREQALIARQAREAAKAEALKNGTIKLGKGKISGLATEIATPTPHAVGKPEKRKYKKRKKAEDQAEETSQTREMTEKTESVPPEDGLEAQPPKPVKEKRAPRPPRSPSPVFDEATMTAEQLAKPTQSYVILIHEALTNSKTGALSLPQIYRAIERRYPYYKLRVQTTGWQSSVRHNLSQHAAFKKTVRDGKGWMWGLVPEIPIEKEKKRRISPPPPIPSQHYYQQGQHMYPPPYPYVGMPSNGHIPPGMGHPSPYTMRPGMPPPAHGFRPYVAAVPRGPNGLPLSLTPQADSGSTYQSPYQPAPLSQPAALEQTTTQQPQPKVLKQEQLAQANPSTTTDIPSTAPKQAPLLLPSYYQSKQLSPSASLLQSHTSSTPAPTTEPSTIGHDIVETVAKFKANLVTALNTTKPNAEEIVQQAISRTLGLTVPAEEFPEEAPIMGAMRKMLEEMRHKERAARQASAPAPPLAVPASPATLAKPAPPPPSASLPQHSAIVTELAVPAPISTQTQLLEILQQLRNEGPVASAQSQLSRVANDEVASDVSSGGPPAAGVKHDREEDCESQPQPQLKRIAT